ncbi:hypothetical protein [Nonomuraea bangladeshensis]|uniref:hypothetical protein n=1 Tax=Nonomuraea bangladeshensis TaxID=404385 RepID=UPI003CD0B89C
MGEPLTGHTNTVWKVVTTQLNDHPIAVTCSDDGAIRVWDVTTAATGVIKAVTTAILNGRQVAITAVADATIRVWDVETGEPVGDPLTGHTGPSIRSLPPSWTSGSSCTASAPTTPSAPGTPPPGNRPTPSPTPDPPHHRRPQRPALHRHRRLRQGHPPLGPDYRHPTPATRYRRWAQALATTTGCDGRPLAISGTYRGALRVHDLNTNQNTAPTPPATTTASRSAKTPSPQPTTATSSPSPPAPAPMNRSRPGTPPPARPPANYLFTMPKTWRPPS